jgi:hypothetical protein
MMLALTEWAPTEHRLTRCHASGDRGGLCKLCLSGRADTLLHSLSCEHPSLTELREAVFDGLPVEEAEAPGGSTLRVPAFFDPSGVRTLPCRSDVEPGILAQYRAHDPLAGMLGVLPTGLGRTVVLGPDTLATDAAARVAACRLALLRGALKVWKLRCRLLGQWWDSDAGSVHWASVLTRRVAALRAHGWQKEADAMSKWLLRFPERPPTRVSSRLPRPRDFSFPMITSSAADEAQAAFEDALDVDAAGNLRPPPLPRW